MRTPWSNARNVLAVRLDNMGDVLMTTPALRALRQAHAGRRLTLLCSRSGAALAPYLPSVDDAVVYEAQWVRNERTADPALDLAMIETLRARSFDAAVIFTVYSQSALPAALLCRLAGIPLVLAHARENPYCLLSDWARDTAVEDGGRHETQRQLDLVAQVGARAGDVRLEFAVRDDDRRAVRALLATHGIADPARCMLVHPGASAPSRRYPPERYAETVRLLSASAPVVLTGDPSERALAQSVNTMAGECALNLAGRLSLGEMAALVAEAGILVANNSGPVHIAAAVGTPVVDLYALTNPQHTPWAVEHRLLYQDVPCKYCYRSVCPEGHHACLAGVAPQAVADAARELFTH